MLEDIQNNAIEWWTNQKFDNDRWLKHSKYMELFTKVNIKSNKIGESFEGRDIHEYEWGSGSRGAILWSQMHGNEATATYAIHDLLLYIQENEGQDWVQYLKSKIHFRVIPMVNPDGAEVWSRRTALNIDPNRDAVALQAQETRLLMDRIKASGAEVAFNLHDQRNIFHLEHTDKSAVISFLAPSSDVSRSVNHTRRKAMNWISFLQQELKKVHPEGAAKYTDEFYPTAFGENVQALGIPTVLIESGAAINDENRNTARKLNFYLLISALYQLAESHKLDSFAQKDYEAIPLNDNKQWDLLLKNVVIGADKDLKADLGVRYNYFPNEGSGKLDFKAVIGDIGDLNHHCGLQVLDAKGAWFENGKRLPRLDEVATFNLSTERESYSVVNGRYSHK